MRPDQAAAYVEALVDCTLGRDAHNPERCAVVLGNRWCWTELSRSCSPPSTSASAGARRSPPVCEEPWIETAQDWARRLGAGAAPHLLAGVGDAELAGLTQEPEPDRRPQWRARLAEAFPPGACAEPLDDWAGVSRRIGGPYAGEHRIETAPSRIRALGALASDVPDGWLPVLLVDLRTGVGWRVGLVARGDRVVVW